MSENYLPNSIPWAAKQLKIGASTMRRLVVNGEVNCVRVNGLRRIPDSEIERLRELLGRGEHRAWQRLAEQVRDVDRKRLAAEERLLARKQELLKELRELETP